MAVTYQKSGVNYLLMDAFKNESIKAGNNAPQLLEFPDFYITDVLEGLGSLNQLSDDIYAKTGKDFYYQVGWGNAATIINDLAAVGATPLTLKLFVAAGNESWFANRKRWRNLIKGFKEAAEYSEAMWNGGETQTLVNVISKESIILAGSTTGIIQPKSRLIDDQKIKKGDAIIFLESSGVHTNGITLIRKLFKDDIDIYIEAIKHKTIIYSPLVQEILKSNVDIHFASHITGHGWRKIMRSKRDFVYRITTIPKPQKIFGSIQKKAKLSDYHMYSDYNMGIGYVLMVDEKDIDRVLSIAKKSKMRG